MSVILIAVLAFVAAMLALYPLFRTEQRVAIRDAVDPALETLLSQREATYAAIKDLDFDRAQGKLSEVDYTDLRTKYETKALAILQELQVADESEKAARSFESTAGAGGCPHCGARFTLDDRFCRVCGNPLTAQCPVCGASRMEGDQFCRRCGAMVSPATA